MQAYQLLVVPFLTILYTAAATPRHLPLLFSGSLKFKIRSMKKVFVVILSAFTLVSFSQKVANPLTFTKGQTLAVTTNLNITAESMIGPSSGTITIGDVYTVSDATAGNFTLVKVPKQVKMNFSMGGQEMKVDSDNPKDLTGMMGDPVKQIMSQKPEFTIDATGKIVGVKKTEAKKEEAGPNMMGMMLPGMDLTSVPQVGNPSIFQVLPNREVKVGDSWTDSINLEGNRNVTVYKVKEITGNEIVLDFTGEGNTITTQSAMGMTIDVNAATKLSGNILIDKATGIIRQKTTTTTSSTSMNLGGQEMTSTIKSTAVTNVSSM